MYVCITYIHPLGLGTEEVITFADQVHCVASFPGRAGGGGGGGGFTRYVPRPRGCMYVPRPRGCMYIVCITYVLPWDSLGLGTEEVITFADQVHCVDIHRYNFNTSVQHSVIDLYITSQVLLKELSC